MIGIDSADAELIERWSAEGHLPNLQSLRERGISGRLDTTADVFHVSAWPTIHTGTLPGKHGIYHAYQIRAGEQNIHRARAEECARPPFWKFLDDAGRHCVVMDAFFNRPVDGFRGVQILEYGTWTWFTEPTSTPRGMLKEITKKFGPYPPPEHTKVLTVPEPRGFRDLLVSGAAVKSKIVRWLMREQPWDLLYVTFGETHPAGHYLWHLSDPEHPAHSAATAVGLEHAVRDVYAAVDSAIGEILGEVDDSVTVLVTSGDGIGPNYAGCHLVPEVLCRLGIYHAAGVGNAVARAGASSDGAVGGDGRRARAKKKGLLSVIRELIPLSVRQSVTRFLPPELHYRMSMKWVNAGIDWPRSKVFTIPNANEGYVRINLKGREPEGIVEPGAEYRDLLGEVREQVKELVNPESGRVAASDVHTIDELFSGEKRPDLPDISITWDPEARVLAHLASERCGTVSKEAGYLTAPYYTGNHRPTAFVLGCGGRVPSGRRLADGHIVDIAPTVLGLLGVDPPSDMDGRVWAEFAD